MKYPLSSKRNILTTALILGFGMAANSQAAIYSFDIDNPGGSIGAGSVTNYASSYNSDSGQLNWQSTISASGGNLANGFWLVMSDGANPKTHYNEYSIFYGDSATGNLSAYVYNGANSSNSWNAPGEFIETFGGAFQSDTSVAGEVTFSFSIDATNINDYTPSTAGTNDWDGAQFGENIGVWYHPVVFNNSPTYNADGSLASFSYSSQSWYDTAGQPTAVAVVAPPIIGHPPVTVPPTTVPESGTLALTSLGLLGLIAGRRRRKDK